jgi:hypothetical protein
MWLLWFEFGALTLLISLLLGSLARRSWAQRKRRINWGFPPPHGFDAIPVQRRVNHLRQDFAAVAALRSRKTPGHDLVVAAVRRSLKQRSYFQPAAVGPKETANQEVVEEHT